MKTLIHSFLLVLLLLPILNAQEQHTFSSKEDIFTNWIKQNGQTAYNWNNDAHRVGELQQTYWYEIRNFDCWQWTYSEIPTEATVTSVTIKFRANKGNWPDSFTFSLHSVPYILNTPDVNFFNESNSNQIFLSSALTPDANHNVFFNQTFTPQSPVGAGWEVWNAVNNAVQSGNYFLTLGLRERVSLLLPYWNISGYDLSVGTSQPCVDLIINYTTPNNYYSFYNKIGARVDDGSLILNDESEIPSGSEPVFLSWGTPNTVRTAELPFLVNWDNTGTTQKDNYWDLGSEYNYSLNYDFNAISSSPSVLKATFLPTENSLVKNNAPELEDVHIGNFSFTDPWFYYQGGGDQWHQKLDPTTYSNPLNILNNSQFSYGGVFLNQGGTSFTPPYYSVKVDQYQNIPISQTGRNHRFYLKNWTGTNANFQYPTNNQTGVVFTSNNSIVQANLKGTQLSNNTDAYNNNSQRKFVRTDNGNLHNVYISMDALWYERSTDGGATWEIANNGKPINTNNPKHPSIDYLRPSSGDEVIVIAYQQQTSTGSQVVIDVYKNGLPRAGVYRSEVISFSHSASEYGTMNAEPVIALADQWDFLIVYKVPGLLPLEGSASTTSGLYYSFGWLNGLIGWELTWWSPSNKWVLIPTTGLNSVHASIDDDIYSSYNYFHIAYEENNQIKYYYRYGQPRTGSLVQTSNPYSISSGNGFTQNYQPSIIGMGTTARVCWVGYRMSYVEQERENEVDAVPQYKVLFKCPTNPGSFWQFGSNVSSPNINNQNDNTYYAFGWSENQSQLKFADNSLSTVRTLTDVAGQNIQISNGTNKNSMYAMVYEHNVGVPFYFERSNNLGSFYVPAKITNTYFSSGREGIVSVDSAAFYFALGDVLVDGVAVNFKEMSDSIVINNLNSLNEYLITEPFDLSDNSSFIYSVQFGLNDSLSAVQAIVDNKFINFKLLLIDGNTNEVISVYDNITFNSTNLFQYNNFAYHVNTQGIGNRTVKMKLLVDVNFDAGYSLSQIYSNSEEGVLGKSKIKQINFNDGEIITTYELSQNYPNPFNPITIIKYQIPQDGIVTLKIFDIIGEEVATLVNEEKLAGKYEVNFNASSFASGVYIYKIQSGAFVSSKKMILLK